MWSTAREIAAGDVVIFWLTREQLLPVTITPGKEYNSKFGYYHHSDLIGVPYGSKVASKNGRGFMHILRPTPELWTLALPHRTQILYIADIAFVCAWLDLKPGSRVIEAGTGSGSFSHSVARTVAPTGHLWSYEFHETRARKAREEFSAHGMDESVTLTHRNVCKEGFTVADTVDAVFLDLPAPWDAIEHAKSALRKDTTGRICCFSPCIEQVLRTVSALNAAGFTDITMFESLQRPHDVTAAPRPIDIGEISRKLKLAEIKREEKRQRQLAANAAQLTKASATAKRKHDEAEHEDTDELDVKKVKVEDEVDNQVVVGLDQIEEPSASTTGVSFTEMAVSKAFPEVKGHTSYLTFACLLPACIRDRFEVKAFHSDVDAARAMDVDDNTPEAKTEDS